MTTIVKDFILVGEFCEVSGPQAVLTIPGQISSQPTHLNNNKCFNLDEFLLYIMTTDYQNFQGDKWSETADVACMRTNICPDFHAVLHYFTLKDPQARGSVRPSCIAYITQDSTKMFRFKKELISIVNMAAQIFKASNMRWMESLGHKVEIQEKEIIGSILDQLSNKRSEQQSMVTLEENEEDRNKLKSWEKLCTSAMSPVLFGLLQLHKNVSRPLEEHVLDPKELTSSYELFRSCNSDRVEDFETLLNRVKVN